MSLAYYYDPAAFRDPEQTLVRLAADGLVHRRASRSDTNSGSGCASRRDLDMSLLDAEGVLNFVIEATRLKTTRAIIAKYGDRFS